MVFIGNVLPASADGNENEWLWPFVVILVANICANYLMVQHFGLYEDDLALILNASNVPLDVKNALANFFSLKANMGRPLQYLATELSQVIIYASQSLTCLYLVSALLQSIGALLWYRVARLRCDAPTALLAAILSLILPIHTMGQFLTGAVGFSFATICLMTAILMYGSKRWYLWAGSYFVAIGALFAYETYYLLFALAPWIWRPILGKRAAALGLFGHAAVVLAIFTSVAFYRQFAGIRPFTSVSAGMTAPELLWKLITTNLGFAFHSAMFIPAVVSTAYDNAALVGGSLIGIVIAALIGARTSARTFVSLDHFFLALALIVMAYPIGYFVALGAVYYEQFTTQMSRLNCAAVFGWALLISLAVQKLAHLTARPALARLLLTCAVLIPFCINRVGVQESYSDAWQTTQRQACEIIAATSDADETTRIIIDSPPAPLTPTYVIGDWPYGWPFLIEGLFSDQASGEKLSNPDTSAKPNIQLLNSDWGDHLKKNPDGSLFVGGVWPVVNMIPGKIIRFKMTPDRRLLRDATPVYFEGSKIAGESRSSTPNYWERAHLRRSAAAVAPLLAKCYSDIRAKLKA